MSSSAMGQYLWEFLSRRINPVSSVPLGHIYFTDESSLFFGSKVVNTELHKALPAVATHVDHLCVKALQVCSPQL